MGFLIRKAFDGLIARGSLEVICADGERLSYCDGSGNPVIMRFLDKAAERAFVFDAEMALGELYTDGRLVLDKGTIFDALDLLLRETHDAKAPLLVRAYDWLRLKTRMLKQRNILSRSRENVAHHYQIDERLYALFLDEDWQYSCAYYERPDMSLEEAQQAKKRHIAAKLLLDGNQSVLDIGCGWGGLGLYLAQSGGARDVTGISLSENQIAAARRRANEAGLTDRVHFNLQDYRTQSGSFDRIVSVGMFEHVGMGYYDTFFRTCHDRLDEDGVMLLHTIGNIEEPSHTNAWLTKYIFPGGHVPAITEIFPAIERSGLVVTDVEILRLHYAYTLREWRRRFLERWKEAVTLYDERFCRMWEFYLAMSETAFLHEGVVVFQIQLARRQGAVPVTRNYLEEKEKNLVKVEMNPYEPMLMVSEKFCLG